MERCTPVYNLPVFPEPTPCTIFTDEHEVVIEEEIKAFKTVCPNCNWIKLTESTRDNHIIKCRNCREGRYIRGRK